MTTPPNAPGAIPDTRATHHLGLFYALQDVRSGCLLTCTGPDGYPFVRLFPTCADACLERHAWCARRFAARLVPPPAREAVRIVPMTAARVIALRETEHAARHYRAMSGCGGVSRPAPRPSHDPAGLRRVLAAIDRLEPLPPRPWWRRADAAVGRLFDWLAARTDWLILVIAALLLLAWACGWAS